MDAKLRPLGSVDYTEIVKAFFFIVAVNAVGAFPAVFTGAGTEWIESRPWFFPPGFVFPIVWTLLFTLIGVALYLVWNVYRNSKEDAERNEARIALLAFGVQMVFNVSWTPVFFGLQRPELGLVVIVALWFSIFVTFVVFRRVDRRAGFLLVPYLGWVSFAAFLNYAIYAGIG